MTYEQGQEHYEFSPEQIELLVDRSRALNNRYAHAESLERIGTGTFDGSMVSVSGSDMPNFSLDSRDISVFAPEGFDVITINLWDFLSGLDEPILIGRSLALNLRLLFSDTTEKGSIVRVNLSDAENADVGIPNPIQYFDPTKDLVVNYTEHPTTPDGKLLNREQYTDQTPLPVSQFRRFTKGDYDDMMEMLGAGLET